MANDFEPRVFFNSSTGFHVDVKIAEMMKETNPRMEELAGVSFWKNGQIVNNPEALAILAIGINKGPLALRQLQTGRL